MAGVHDPVPAAALWIALAGIVMGDLFCRDDIRSALREPWRDGYGDVGIPEGGAGGDGGGGDFGSA